MERTALFFDFDGTVTIGDALDAVIERFSVSGQWRSWESAWNRGDLSTAECLALQVGDLSVDPDELTRFVGRTAIDACFPAIVDWCRDKRTPLCIVSDNFSLIVRAILKRSSLEGVHVFANELSFDGNKPRAYFPHASPRCARCAHCKVIHYAAFASHRKIFVGDGLSDICPAVAADVVFAKDALADHLAGVGVPFMPFANLGDVLRYLESDSMHRGAAASGPAEVTEQG